MASAHNGPLTPGAALAELFAGNERFVTGSRIHPHQDPSYRAALAARQLPFAVVFGCSDSRLAAEMIFDRGLGDLFVVRTAGHILGAEVLASIEYGVTVLGTPLVVVLGHDSCGAIQATLDAQTTPLGGNLGVIVDRVAPSLAQAQAEQITDPDQIARLHVRRTVAALMRDSEAIAAAVTAGRCCVVGMSYRLAEGRTTLVTPGPGAGDERLPVLAANAEA
jgi:carbonic anhydrase